MLTLMLPLLGLTLALLAGGAAAEGRHGWRDQGHAWSGAQGRTLDDVVSRWRSRNGGRVLSAETIEEDGRAVHRLRILDERGQVRGLRFDGASGTPLPRLPMRYQRWSPR
jgi:hypothetical protein